jgi:iron complex outermembrane receptor protein
MEGLTVRASVGTGFRAPGLGDLVANTSFSADYHTDYYKCNELGISRADCNEEQVNTYISANPNLGPEESESTNIGVIYEFGNNQLAVDFFETEIDGIITSVTVQDIIDASILGASFSNQLTSQGAFCTRVSSQAGAPLQECFRGPINGNATTTSGADIKYSGLFETGVGDFDVNLNMVVMDESESEAFFNGPLVNFVGLQSIPEMRYILTVGHGLQAVPNLYVSAQYEYIDEVADTTDADYNPTSMVDDMGMVNLRAAYVVPGMENLTVSVSVRNVTKEDPPLTQSGGYNRLLHTDMGMYTTVGFTLEL